MISTELVQRLGFNSYATNLAVNLIEDNNLRNGYHIENDDYELSVIKFGKQHLVTVRAYVPSVGWETAEILL